MNKTLELLIWNKLKNANNGGGSIPPVEMSSNYTSMSSQSHGNVAEAIETLPEINMNVNSCNNLFLKFYNLKEVIVNFKVSPSKFGAMFNNCINLEKVTFKGHDTSNVTSMGSMFSNCKKLKNIPTFSLDSATDTSNMFDQCTALEVAPSLDVSNVENLNSMYSQCTNLKNVPVYLWSSATDLRYMFEQCPNLTDESINNIMTSCMSASSYSRTKTLADLGFNSSDYPATRIQGLDAYADFVASGWSIGY